MIQAQPPPPPTTNKNKNKTGTTTSTTNNKNQAQPPTPTNKNKSGTTTSTNNNKHHQHQHQWERMCVKTSRVRKATTAHTPRQLQASNAWEKIHTQFTATQARTGNSTRAGRESGVLVCVCVDRKVEWNAG
ncbi:hypothetical protein Pmani_027747 [Petrolisthes manimaculis]|uniref:Uncharacterized protein n=1 Tax=Petrolisthes manimaculis TaxID=1843537 RepID=A0AAE1P3I7_9EUCA|nr:hypothetical protein Pmani_027747 [Petrolisthes manimaculis]